MADEGSFQVGVVSSMAPRNSSLQDLVLIYVIVSN